MVKLKNITVRFGNHTILDNFSLSVADGERLAIMGPSGSGKTTILKLIAGQLSPTAGIIHVNTERISYMFQEPRLLPWLTAEENVNLVLGDCAETLPEARKWLSCVELEGSEKKYPAELSGGMRQRVALARALAYGGELLLLDEPLSALDADLSEKILQLFSQYAKNKTVVFVTHNEAHAKLLTNNIIHL